VVWPRTVPRDSTQLNFVPEHSRDFIFTVLAEEWGFVGTTIALGLYAAVLYAGVRTMLVRA